MPNVISENEVLKKSEGHIAYEPLKNRNANAAKKSGPATDLMPRTTNQNSSPALDAKAAISSKANDCCRPKAVIHLLY
jgi:hypothetical protein